ncbi:MAG: hypothetical protein Q9211_002128 [Gyalolechia sp. 1 TL-2023]
MEVLAGAASIIAVVEVTAKIGELCGTHIREVRHAPDDIERLRSKVVALHAVLMRLHKLPPSEIDASAVQNCNKYLDSLLKRLEPKKQHSSMRRMGLRALKWPFTSKEVGDQVQAIEQYLVIFNLSLQLGISERTTDAEQDRLLDKLAYVGEAILTSYETSRRHRQCLPSTRVDVLQQIMNWTVDTSPRCIFWLKGLAGTGKSTIAKTIASSLKAVSSHLATYFFKRGHGDLAHVRRLLPTIVRQWVRFSPSYRQSVLDVIKKDPNIGQSADIREQYETLIVGPLRLSRQLEPSSEPFIIVMDALDECDDETDLRMLLKLFATTNDLPDLRIKIFVSSRPDLSRHGFEEMPSVFHYTMVLQDVPRAIVDRDIKIYLSHELKAIQERFRLPSQWPSMEEQNTLATKAGGLFIFAATACRFIGGASQAKPQERLEQICSSVTMNKLMTEELDQMYALVLQNSIKGRYTDEEQQRNRLRFIHIVGRIVILLDPLPMSQLFMLFGGAHFESQEELEGVLQTLHSVIDIPEDANNPVQTLHLSFRDFLLDPDRCFDRQFWVDEEQANQTLAVDCLRLMSSSLQRNMCGLTSLGTLKAKIDLTLIEKAFSPAVRYACRHWAEHASRARSQFQKFSVVYEFIHDSRRFATNFRHIIEQAPEQLYVSAILFSPMQSSVRQIFASSVPRWIRLRPQLDETWGPSLQTIECSYSVRSACFLQGDRLIATSGRLYSPQNHRSFEKLEIWDAQTGERQTNLLPITGDSTRIMKLSADGLTVVLVSSDNVLKFWDIAKRDFRFVLEKGHSQIVCTELSGDNNFLAVGYEDGTIQLYGTTAGDCRHELGGHSDRIIGLDFSPDSKIIATSSLNAVLRLWNVQNGSLLHTVEGLHIDYADSSIIAFSSDGKLLAVALKIAAIQVWDVAMGKVELNLEVTVETARPPRFLHVAPSPPRQTLPEKVLFSPNGEVLASVLNNYTIHVWDVRTGACLSTFEGLGVVAFSSNGELLASGFAEDQVQVWNIQKDVLHCNLEGHTRPLSAINFSDDGRTLLSGSSDRTARVWDIQRGAGQPSNWKERAYKTNFSNDGKAVVLLLFFGVRVFDFETGDCRLRYDGDVVSFSSEGQLVIITSDGDTRVADLQTGSHSNLPNGDLYTLSTDGQLAAFVDDNEKDIRVWNIRRDEETVCFAYNHETLIKKLLFSSDSDLLASRTGGEVRIWTIRTGNCISIVDNRFGVFQDMAFSPNNKLLAFTDFEEDKSGYSASLCLWDVRAARLRFKFDWDLWFKNKIVFGPDSRLVAVVSDYYDDDDDDDDYGILVWNTQTGERILTQRSHSYKPRVEFLAGIDALFIDGKPYATGTAKLTEAEVARYSRSISSLQIDKSRTWVTKSSERVLWLPPERRPDAYAVWGNQMAISSNNGLITFLTFTDEVES